jgi:hypothetical protein
MLYISEVRQREQKKKQKECRIRFLPKMSTIGILNNLNNSFYGTAIKRSVSRNKDRVSLNKI